MEQVAQAPPIVGPAHVTHRTIVNVELSSDSTGTWLFTHRGTRIKPRSLMIEYLNGKLWKCSVAGRKVRQDGHEYLDGSEDSRTFMALDGRNRALSARAPEWVAELVYLHAPADTVINRTDDGSD